MLRGVAEDSEDRNLALAVWVGLFCGGPLIAVVVAVIKWSDRRSLARQHAVVALWMYAGVFVVYAPVTLWTFGFQGPQWAFMAVWVIAVAVTVAVTAIGVIGAFRSPIATGGVPGAARTDGSPPV